MLDPFQLPFVQRGILELVILSVGAGLLGTWIVLRGLAFFSHAVGAAAFPGLVLADGLGFAAPLGAIGAALLFAGTVGQLARSRRARYDNLTALALTGALALGVLLASDVFHSGTNVDTLLFGSLFLVEPRDVVIAGCASAVTVGASFAFGPVWLASGFDEEGLRAAGVRSGTRNAVLLVLVALVVVASLSAVGALLATALLVVPAATMRLWINRLPQWQMATILLTAAESVAGVWLSVKLNAPPGATIATLAGGVFALAAIARSSARSIVRRVVPALAASIAIAGVAGCGTSSTGSSGGKVDVVATTTQIGDWARAVGGPKADVHQILKANTDPHEYEPRPADVQAVADAEIVFTNGDELDGWTQKLVDEAGGNPRVVDLSTHVPTVLPGENTGPERSTHDPHWWHDPTNAEAAVREIEVALERAAPSAGAAFARRAKRYETKLGVLDEQIRTCLRRLPPHRRELVTDHDAFGYFAHRYGLEVVGAVIPSQTTQAQPSARDLSRLAEIVRREHVASIFPESSLSPKLAEAIARQTGAAAGLTLYGDTLGPPGSSADTYLKMEAVNARTIALGLSGGRLECRVGASL
jgi:ABC-type Zn uptake system ZnuABC Zn-binding protein ZnuA/ABC-type Mn2+/Zn2+ transport system permease subunit